MMLAVVTSPPHNVLVTEIAKRRLTTIWPPSRRTRRMTARAYW